MKSTEYLVTIKVHYLPVVFNADFTGLSDDEHEHCLAWLREWDRMTEKSNGTHWTLEMPESIDDAMDHDTQELTTTLHIWNPCTSRMTK